ncbi:hypothetical protein K431DRAFT_282361 [Polychaeton citri CBS 116435]|uniref:Calcineurin-like phosphoesterase domain-containing protein n=1 Tax=Polychaeton citri CBS 116435 TaxID=1314669 RepID=A0A9P4USU5_9PEZI|nr:hypothetical protein K431DRAFT_282361 [Polychaeton citri CBS 116435]
MSTPNAIKTRILIISDTHGAPLTYQDATTNRQRSKLTPPFEHPLPKADLLIHCGDLTVTGQMDEYHATLDMLKHIDAPTKLVIPGNHDLSLDRDYVFGHPRIYAHRNELEAQALWDEAREIWTAPLGRARQEGVTFLDEGMHSIPLANGAKVNVYASAYTPEFMDWGFPYNKDEDRFNSPSTGLSDARNVAPYPVPSFTEAREPVDVLVTHGPPLGRLDATMTGLNVGCPHLLRALMRARPLVHCFGHIHEGWGAERVRWGEAADALVEKACSIEDWVGGNWMAGVEGKGVETVEVDLDRARDAHGVFVDLTEGTKGLERGRESLLVNAAIMDVHYRPINGAWVIDLDLPTASG